MDKSEQATYPLVLLELLRTTTILQQIIIKIKGVTNVR